MTSTSPQHHITARMYIGAPGGRLGLRGAASRRSATWPLGPFGLGATSHTRPRYTKCTSDCPSVIVRKYSGVLSSGEALVSYQDKVRLHSTPFLLHALLPLPDIQCSQRPSSFEARVVMSKVLLLNYGSPQTLDLFLPSRVTSLNSDTFSEEVTAAVATSDGHFV